MWLRGPSCGARAMDPSHPGGQHGSVAGCADLALGCPGSALVLGISWSAQASQMDLSCTFRCTVSKSGPCTIGSIETLQLGLPDLQSLPHIAILHSPAQELDSIDFYQFPQVGYGL